MIAFGPPGRDEFISQMEIKRFESGYGSARSTTASTMLEDRHVDSDAERQGQNGHRRKCRSASEQAQRMADVVEKRFERRKSANVPNPLLCLMESAQRHRRTTLGLGRRDPRCSYSRANRS